MKTNVSVSTDELCLSINNNNLNNLISYTHSTKEVIQLIKFLKRELVIPEPYNKYCFRTAITENKFISCNDTYNKLFTDTNTFIIEICSSKKYIHNNFYLHHLSVDKRFGRYNETDVEILNNFLIEKQSDEELLQVARERGTTTYHQMGTCRMGPKSDPTAVVDDNLKVYGLKNIRVIDASIMPTMLSANLHSGATLIGEKGSDLVLGNNPIDPVILNY